MNLTELSELLAIFTDQSHPGARDFLAHVSGIKLKIDIRIGSSKHPSAAEGGYRWLRRA